MRIANPLRTLALVLATALIAPAAAAAAPPGAPTRGFGSGGTATLAGPVVATPVPVLAPSGRLLVAGATTSGAIVIRRVDAATGAPAGVTRTPVPGGRAGAIGQLHAVLAADGRLLVAVAVTREASSFETVRLLAFDATGRPDRGFGVGGQVVVTDRAETDNPIGLAVGPTGEAYVATELLTLPDTGRLAVLRFDAAGRAVASGSAPVSRLRDDPVSMPLSVVPLADGSALLADSTQGGDGYLVRFGADGQWDTGYGRRGIAALPVQGMKIDDAILQGSDHLLLAGGRLSFVSRSGSASGSPVLLRAGLDGTLDRRFASIGRGVLLDTELTSIATDGTTIVGERPDGRIARFTASGEPDLGFGLGGVSLPPRAPLVSPDPFGGDAAGDPPVIDGDGAIAPAQAGSAAHPRPALTRFGLGGRGLPRPRARRWALATRLGGSVAVRVPQAVRDVTLTGSVALVLSPRQIGDDEEEGIEYPPAGLVDARHGSARIAGVGGTAVLRGARVALVRSRSTVAGIDLRAGGCGRRASLALRGPFRVRSGSITATTRGRGARLTLDACDRRHPIRVVSGHATIVRDRRARTAAERSSRGG